MTPETMQGLQFAAGGAAVALVVAALVTVIYAASRGQAGRLTDAIVWLQGKKTNVLAAVITGLEAAGQFGLMDPDLARKIEAFLLVGIIYTFRAAITKVEQAIPKKETT